MDFGEIHRLSKKITHYKYCVVKPYLLTWKNRYQVVVPEGFLADGSSGGPDYPDDKWIVMAWVCHDWLYRHHYYYDLETEQNVAISRDVADAIMYDCLLRSGKWWYASLFWVVFKFNLLCQPSSAWQCAVEEGPDWMQDHPDHPDYDIIFEYEHSD